MFVVCGLGMYLRFTTNAREVRVNHTTRFPETNLWHMPESGTDALDVYAYSTADKAWRHLPCSAGVQLVPQRGPRIAFCLSASFYISALASFSSLRQRIWLVTLTFSFARKVQTGSDPNPVHFEPRTQRAPSLGLRTGRTWFTCR